MIELISEETEISFREAKNRFEAMSARDALVQLMGTLNTLSVSLMKIANDLRLLSSGPRAGFNEINLMPMQPGSSIMPGKVNPVIPEMLIQVAAQVMGFHLVVSIGGQTGPLEVNMMQPLIGYNVLKSVEILKNAIRIFRERCIDGIEANVDRCKELAERSLALATVLVPLIGYDRAAKIAEKAMKEGKTIKEVVLEEGILSKEEAEKLLDPKRMVGEG